MKSGDRVRWRGVNRTQNGILEERWPDGEHWTVILASGKRVIVNENSFINE